MPQKIRVLERRVAELIAAGEVVDRPASVVKELLENALDAGATRIDIDCVNGGIGRIAITDDGEGMCPEDALLALERHGTSKLRELDDLNRVATFGFRGEALPSIASVSRFTLTTRERTSDSASRVTLTEDGKPKLEQVGAAPGTTVEVTDLFYNVPARLKFLKSPMAEGAHVVDVCTRAALGNPAIHLRLTRDGKLSREFLSASDEHARAQQAFEEPLQAVSGERGDIAVRAFLSAPERARPGAQSLHLFVNGRAVRDRALARAVAFAYGSVIQAGRYPVGVVHVRVPAANVDVNIHPQKNEVRFAASRDVFDAVARILGSKLGTTPFVRASRPSSVFSLVGLSSAPSGAAPLDVREVVANYATVPPLPTAADAEPVPQDVGTPVIPKTGNSRFSRMRVLEQVRRAWIICADDEGLHVIDQHAADERVRYDRLTQAYRARAVRTQQLLFPEKVEMLASQIDWIDTHPDVLADLGFDAGLLGGGTVVIRSLPTLLARIPAGQLIRDAVAQLMFAADREFGDAVDRMLSTQACHAAIRTGDALSPAECAALLRDLDEVNEFSGHCPHGRPVAVTLTFDEIARRVGR